ncbi:MAG: hypothetical protein KF746_08635 [Chitinophagaceae bacterium]|nr:hypothetical protein [Chitinophagaceae bacterium]
MRKYFFTGIACLFIACSSQKKMVSQAEDKDPGIGDTRTYTVEFIDEDTYLLTETSTDKTYGYTKENPVKTGGNRERIGPVSERRFLNALLGPNGEPIAYFRAGSCCSFKTPNGLLNNMGLLDIYRVWWEGSKDTVSIYINMYDKGDLYIPAGFTARK